MRKGITITMTLLCIWMLLTGIIELVSPGTDAAHHVVAASLFIVMLVIHMWLNRKAFLRYFTNLGWQWIFIVLGIVLIVVTTIGH